jgi:hypothetical protein
MRQRYIWDEKQNKLVKAEEYERPARMQIITDIDQQGRSYESPVRPGVWITSRADMREDLKITGCRQVDPGENKDFYNRR